MLYGWRLAQFQTKLIVYIYQNMPYGKLTDLR